MDNRPVDWTGYPVVPSRIRLVVAQFVDNEAIPDEACTGFAANPQLFERLLLARSSPVNLSAAIEVTTAEEAPAFLRVMYAIDFALSAEMPEDERENLLRVSAYYIAPRTIYPYLREFVSNLTKRWRGGEILLPYFPIPIPPSEDGELIVPPPPPGEVYRQGEIPLEQQGPVDTGPARG